MTTVGSIPALRALTPAALAAVVRDSRPARLGAGTVVRHAGEPARAVVLLLSGTMVTAYRGPSGTEVWPARWQGPSIVDKASVLDGGRTLTALVASTECVARLLPRARFIRLLDEEHSVRTHVLNWLAQDALAGRKRLIEAVSLPAVAQVAAWLHAHTAAHDPARSADHAVAWRGSQEDLARLLGLSRVTVNRALSRLVRAGALRLTPRGIVVVDRRRLGRLADGRDGIG